MDPMPRGKHPTWWPCLTLPSQLAGCIRGSGQRWLRQAGTGWILFCSDPHFEAFLPEPLARTFCVLDCSSLPFHPSPSPLASPCLRFLTTSSPHRTNRSVTPVFSAAGSVCRCFAGLLASAGIYASRSKGQAVDAAADDSSGYIQIA